MKTFGAALLSLGTLACVFPHVNAVSEYYHDGSDVIILYEPGLIDHLHYYNN